MTRESEVKDLRAVVLGRGSKAEDACNSWRSSITELIERVVRAGTRGQIVPPYLTAYQHL